MSLDILPSSTLLVRHQMMGMAKWAVSLSPHLAATHGMVQRCSSHHCALRRWASFAKQLHMPEFHGRLIAEDFNAIQDFDCTLHTRNHLRDAYLARWVDKKTPRKGTRGVSKFTLASMSVMAVPPYG
ncbi:MAG: hypothetical protein LQ341_000907 [Variospora aurantia]|nr:MAG: hypothetical protein LQ341_000907 [Variospora aurantia]